MLYRLSNYQTEALEHFLSTSISYINMTVSIINKSLRWKMKVFTFINEYTTLSTLNTLSTFIVFCEDVIVQRIEGKPIFYDIP